MQWSQVLLKFCWCWCQRASHGRRRVRTKLLTRTPQDAFLLLTGPQVASRSPCLSLAPRGAGAAHVPCAACHCVMGSGSASDSVRFLFTPTCEGGHGHPRLTAEFTAVQTFSTGPGSPSKR